MREENGCFPNFMGRASVWQACSVPFGVNQNISSKTWQLKIRASISCREVSQQFSAPGAA